MSRSAQGQLRRPRRLIPVAHLVRRAESIVLGRFEQKETKRRKGDFGSSLPSLSSVDSQVRCTDECRFLFVSFASFAVTIPSAVASPSVVASLEIFAGDFLRDGTWIAEPDHCSQRREALRVCRELAGWLESSARRG